jgi:hypothetical protein
MPLTAPVATNPRKTPRLPMKFMIGSLSVAMLRRSQSD